MKTTGGSVRRSTIRPRRRPESLVEIYEVFRRSGHKQPFEHCGSVTAPDVGMATVMAKECFTRRGEGRHLWVIRRADIHTWSDDSLPDPAADKSYRFAHAYRDVIKKRALARSRAQADAR